MLEELLFKGAWVHFQIFCKFHKGGQLLWLPVCFCGSDYRLCEQSVKGVIFHDTCRLTWLLQFVLIYCVRTVVPCDRGDVKDRTSLRGEGSGSRQTAILPVQVKV